MEPWNLPLAFDAAQAAALRKEQTLLFEALEKNGLLDTEHLNRLRAALVIAVEAQAAAGPDFLTRLRDDARVRQHLLHLYAADGADELLNLPWHLPALRLLEVPGRSFDEIAAALHRALGGNYRALEFFDELCRNAPDAVPGTLDELDALLRERSGETLRHIAADLTLAERRAGEAEGRVYNIVPPLVRELLADSGLKAADFDDDRAGAYYEKMDKDLNQRNYADLEEAFFHYERVKNITKLNKTGNTLSGFYYSTSQFQRAFDFARRVEALAGE